MHTRLRVHVALTCHCRCIHYTPTNIVKRTKDFLHSWQLRLTMIGWSGGYTNDTGTLEWAYVPMDPEQDKVGARWRQTDRSHI